VEDREARWRGCGFAQRAGDHLNNGFRQEVIVAADATC
jgi:hypothetical protein